MTWLSETAEFARRFGDTVRDFRRHESLLRSQYAREDGGNELPRDLLERPTRRFLIDGLLLALGWNVDNPVHVTEEARAKSQSGDRLYFDYLGIAPQTSAPVLLFEAKGFDVPLPRKPRGPELDALGIAELIADAVDALKRGDKTLPVISEWSEFLRDLRSYILSLDELGRLTLRRAVITAGGWIIVFREPLTTFLDGKPANSGSIICYTSLDEMESRAADLYGLLARGILVDTLPFTLKVPEALRMMSARNIGSSFRAVLVSTITVGGARRQHHPVRSVYAALVVKSGGRLFAIVDYDRPVDEPKRQDSIAAFITEMDEKGRDLLGRLGRLFAWDINPESIADFPGFSGTNGQADNDPAATALGPSMAHAVSTNVVPREFVRKSGEPGAVDEFVVVTGDTWFYKADRSASTACEFHSWRAARGKHVAADAAHMGWLANSYTEDGQQRHCAHADLLSVRSRRCHIGPVETHLCCRTCVFAFDCWGNGDVALPCPAAPTE